MDANRYAAGLGLRSWRAAAGGGLVLELGGEPGAASAQIDVAEDGSVRLRAAAGSRLPLDPSTAVGREPWRPTQAEPEPRDGGGVRIGHDGPDGSAHVEVDAAPFALRICERSGRPVAALSDLALAPDGGARLELRCEADERFFGFGESHGGLDKRGRRLLVRNRDPELRRAGPLYLGIPFCLGLQRGPAGVQARGLLLDGFGPASFDVAASDAGCVRVEAHSGGLDLTIFPGPEPRDVLRRFTARVGRGALPPLWALGHHQSRWSYGSEAAVRRIARELRRRAIPTDVIHLDIDYMDGYRVFTWDPRRFPDPKQLLSDLAAEGFRAVAIVDPGVKIDPGYAVYDDGLARDVFCRDDDGELTRLRVWPRQAALPDFNRAEVRRWWGEQHRGLLEAGVAGIWNDMNEPAGWSRDVRIGRLILPYRRQDLSRARQADPAETGHRVPHEHVRNLYGQQECRATHDFLASANPERRPFVLTRSGSTGIQKYAAVWTGDNGSRWTSLRESLPMLLNLSLSGVPFCGADIGGFFGSCTPELYARWIQLGALYPFARTHSIWLSRRQEPWSFGRRVEAIARAALELRMRLLPYLYGLFHEAAANGSPPWRPLFYEFPDDPDAAAIEDQLMLGPSLLVAPVLHAGARERELYLPPGVWLSWDDDARWLGPRRIRVAAPLERLPLFARGGAMLPTRSPVAHAGEAPAEPCVLEVFPGADGGACWVEDDGLTTAYRDGAVARTSLRLWHRAGGRLRLELGRREGAYEIPRRPLRVRVHACPAPLGVVIDGRRLERRAEAPGYALRNGCVDVFLTDTGEGHTLEIEPAP